MKSNVFFMICGIVLGVALSAMGYGVYQIGEGISRWGEPVACSDVEVRKRIADCGVVLPDEAHGLYYVIDGFQDHCEWIRFTVPKHLVWSVVERSRKKKESDFAAGFPQNFQKEIHKPKNTKDDFSWWNPITVKIPCSWSAVTEASAETKHEFEDWVVDAESGVVYITIWNV